MDNTLSFALVTRTQFCELPFLNEFVNYYFELGVHHIYLIYTESERREEFEQRIPSEFRNRISVLVKEPSQRVKGSQNLALSAIKEKYTLSLDMDEFLHLDGLTLPEFVEQCERDNDNGEYGSYLFHWISTCSEALCMPSIESILSDQCFFLSRTKKSMGLTENIVRINEHKMWFREEMPELRLEAGRDHVFVFHVFARGLYDLINKLLYQKFGDRDANKNLREGLEELFFDPSSRYLPDRLVPVVVRSRMEKYQVKIDYSYPKLRYNTDVELLQHIALSGLTQLLDRELVGKDFDAVKSKMDKTRIPERLLDQCGKGKIKARHVAEIIRESGSQRAARRLALIPVLARRLAKKSLNYLRGVKRKLTRETA